MSENGRCVAKGTCPYMNDNYMAINCADGNCRYWEEELSDDEDEQRRSFSKTTENVS